MPAGSGGCRPPWPARTSFEPGSCDVRNVEHREPSSVVLEASAAGAAPDRAEFVVGGQPGGAGGEQAAEDDTAAGCGLLEQQEGRDATPYLGCLVAPGEGVPEQEVAPAAGVVEFVAGAAVVAVVGEDAGLRVEDIGPVGFGCGRVQHGESDAALLGGALVAEAALVPDRQQTCERVVGHRLAAAAVVALIDDQVRCRQGPRRASHRRRSARAEISCRRLDAPPPGPAAGPSLGRLGRRGPWNHAQQRETTLTDGRSFPLVSAASRALVRPRPWSPRRSCRSVRCSRAAPGRWPGPSTPWRRRGRRPPSSSPC